MKMLHDVCSICAQTIDANKIGTLQLFEKKAQKVIQQIKLLTRVLLKPCGLPEFICEKCQLDLKNAIEFRRRCLKAHRNRKKTIETNEDEIIPSTKQSITIISPAAKIDSISVENDQELSRLSDNGALNAHEVEEVETENSLLTLVKKSRKSNQRSELVKTPLPAYFCDKCGINITGKSSFDRHLRKHNDIRPFQCQLCPSRFLSAGELKGHQVKHTGDRNFPCRYCDRSYVNYSGRLRHERTHTNERPFVCSQCGKTFTNSYILKNHMLVHTGERLYSCDLCERDFSRPTHLKTHFRSNTHKQNEEKHIKLESSDFQLVTI